jgi:hypothetical protein
MNNELITTTLRMEGDRFKLLRKLDKCHSIYVYPQIKKEIEELSVKIEQYHNIIEAFRNRPGTRKKC